MLDEHNIFDTSPEGLDANAADVAAPDNGARAGPANRSGNAR
jgi:hypothetical protein